MTRFLLFFLIISPFFSWEQTNRLEQNKLLVDSLFFHDKIEGLKVSEKMLPLAYQLEDTFYITYFLDQAGELNRMFGNYDLAIEQLNNCLDYKVNWKDLKDLSLTHNNLGKAYVDKGIYTLAAEHFTKALKLMERDNNLIGQAYYLNNLGALYDLQHNYEKAITYYEKSLNIKIRLKDEKGIAATSTNLGISYYNIGDYRRSISAYDRAIEVFTKLNIRSKIARAMSNQGKVYLELGEKEDARRKFREALRLNNGDDEPQLTVQILNNISEFFQHTGELDSALYYNNRALKLSHELKAFKVLRDSYRVRAELLKKSLPDSAYTYLLESVKYDDSLINEANIYAVADIEGKYNFEKQQRIIKEKELEKVSLDRELKAKRVQQLVMLLILVFVSGLVALFYFRYKSKQKTNELLSGQNLLIRSQKRDLEQLNEKITQQVDQLQLTVDEKEKLLNSVFSEASDIELPQEILSLSKREMEVLCYLALGRTDEQIAEGLFVSKSTVKTHLRRIYSKLLVSGRAEAVAIAHKYNLLGRDHVS